MTVTQSLAKFIVGLNAPGAIPPEVMEKAKVCLLNGYGIGLACFDTPFAAVASAAAIAIDGERPDFRHAIVVLSSPSFCCCVVVTPLSFHLRWVTSDADLTVKKSRIGT